tara:strand:- start:8802 stop:9359 length:558 start_codon:yes stop_codon:yes gene_type:complete
MIDPATLRKLLDYDPNTGALTWKHRTPDTHPGNRGRRGFNSTHAGKPAFTYDDKDGYKRGTVFSSKLRGHRVAWAIHYGEWPSGEIDHINRDRVDNRISNMRDVTKSENMRNAKMPNTNTSGCIGVHFVKKIRKWRARIGTGKGNVDLGLFTDKDDAIAARKAAEAEQGYSPTHGIAALDAGSGH